MADFIETWVTVNNIAYLATYAEVVKQAPDIVNQMVNRTINNNADRLLTRLRVEPGAPHYPLAWTSARQRRWFFAQVRAGRISVPYQRTHRLVNSWRMIIVYDPGEMTSIRATNDAPERQFVTGPQQQGFHAETGWYKEQDVFAEVQTEMVDAIGTDLTRLLYVIDEIARNK